jgi:hypothetical protein
MIPDLDGFSTQAQARNVVPEAANRQPVIELPRRYSITDITGVHRERVPFLSPTTVL